MNVRGKPPLNFLLMKPRKISVKPLITPSKTSPFLHSSRDVLENHIFDCMPLKHHYHIYMYYLQMNNLKFVILSK